MSFFFWAPFYSLFFFLLRGGGGGHEPLNIPPLLIGPYKLLIICSLVLIEVAHNT